MKDDPIPYQLLTLQAITTFLDMKANLSPRHASVDTLIDCWAVLADWSNGEPAPTDQAVSHPAAGKWLASIVGMRRSPAARLDLGDSGDDGLCWLIDLCDTLNTLIARPGHELSHDELENI